MRAGAPRRRGADDEEAGAAAGEEGGSKLGALVYCLGFFKGLGFSVKLGKGGGRLRVRMRISECISIMSE